MCGKFDDSYTSKFHDDEKKRDRRSAAPPKPSGFDNDEKLSKALSSLLRHQALKAKITVHPGGYVDVEAVLRHFGKRCTEEDIIRVITGDKRERYHIRRNHATGCSQIRANQGHSFPLEDDGTLLSEIHHDDSLLEVAHATTLSAWLVIREQGLSRMKRNHIHFVEGRPKVGDKKLQGYRNTSSVLILVNIRIAIQDGIRFFRSANDVILSPGNEQGFLPVEYFKRVIDTRTHEVLWPREKDSNFLRKLSLSSPVRMLCMGATYLEADRIEEEGIGRGRKEFLILKTPGLALAEAKVESDVLVYVDVKAAIRQGIDFFHKTDEILYCKGDDDGFIPRKFCTKAVDCRTHATMWAPGVTHDLPAGSHNGNQGSPRSRETAHESSGALQNGEWKQVTVYRGSRFSEAQAPTMNNLSGDGKENLGNKVDTDENLRRDGERSESEALNIILREISGMEKRLDRKMDQFQAMVETFAAECDDIPKLEYMIKLLQGRVNMLEGMPRGANRDAHKS